MQKATFYCVLLSLAGMVVLMLYLGADIIRSIPEGNGVIVNKIKWLSLAGVWTGMLNMWAWMLIVRNMKR